MLLVLFQLGHDRYALPASQVVEVIPLVALRKLPQSPRGVAGVFVFRGQPVPAVDLGELLAGQAARERLSTRIIVVEDASFPEGPGGKPWRFAGRLGLIAERATATMKCDPGQFKELGVNLTATPGLGPVITDARGVIQLLQPQKLSRLVADTQALLEAAPEAGHVAH
jgi:chemotaxis-related protein WspB